MTLQTSLPPATPAGDNQPCRGVGLSENLRILGITIAAALTWPVTTVRTRAQQRARDREIRALYRQVFGKPVDAALSASEAKKMVRWRQSRLASAPVLVR